MLIVHGAESLREMGGLVCDAGRSTTTFPRPDHAQYVADRSGAASLSSLIDTSKSSSLAISTISSGVLHKDIFYWRIGSLSHLRTNANRSMGTIMHVDLNYWRVGS